MPAIIAADIGGTNCRFGWFTYDNNQLRLDKVVWIGTELVADMDAFLTACEKELEREIRAADAFVAAIAGPVRDNMQGRLSNASLLVDLNPLKKRCPALPMMLINDFTAQAQAVLSPIGVKAKIIAGPENSPPYSTRAVIGAGTGLGQAAMLWNSPGGSAGDWLVMPSENGHAAFPFVGREECEYQDFLRKRFNIPYAVGDIALTGRGLSALHFYLTGEELEPGEVGARALSSDTETLVWYSRFYGRACRNWVLATLCYGGLWIAGGIAARNPYCVLNKYFYEEFCRSPNWEELLRSIALRLLEDRDSGLWGAARIGARALFYKKLL